MVVSQNKQFTSSFLHWEQLEQTGQEKTLSVEVLQARAEAIEREIAEKKAKAGAMKDLIAAETKLGLLKLQINELQKAQDNIKSVNYDDGLQGFWHTPFNGKDNEKKKLRKANRKLGKAEEIETALAELESTYGLDYHSKEQRLREAINAQKQTLYVTPDGTVTGKNPGISGSKQFNISGQDAVAAFTQVQKDPKKFLDKGWDKTVTGGLMKYTNVTSQQAQIISTVAFFFLLWKGYTALRDGVFKGSNMWTIATLFAGSWMATGMNPAAMIMAFKKTGINQKTQKDFADLFNVESMQYEASEKMQEMDLQEGLAETFIYGLKDKELIAQYYDPSTKGFKAQEILTDFKKDESRFLINTNNPQAPENNLVLEMIAKLETYQAAKQIPEINKKLSPYMGSLASLPTDKFETADAVASSKDIGELRAKFEKAKTAYRGNKEKEIKQVEQQTLSTKLKAIDPNGAIQCDRQKAGVSAGVLGVLNDYSDEDLADPVKAAEAKRKLMKVPGVTVNFPKENNETEATMEDLLRSDFNTKELEWLRENNGQELKKFNAEFLQAREEIFKTTGSTIQLSTDNGLLYLESSRNGKDRKIQLIIPSRTELRLAGFSSSLGAGSYKELFTQGAIVSNIIAECEGSGSATERTPFTVNILSKGIDYKKQGTTIGESLSPSKIHSVDGLLQQSSSRWNNLRGLTNALNGVGFVAEGIKIIARDDGKTETIEQPTIWMDGMDLPQRFKGIKNEQGNYYTTTSSGTNGVTSTDYGMTDRVVDGTVAAATAVGAGVSNARESTVNFFKGQPDKPLDGDYIQTYADYAKEHPEAANLHLNTTGLKPSERIKRKKELEAQTTPIKSYVYGKLVDHKEFSYAFSSLYGYLLQDNKKETKEYYDTNGKPIIQKRKNKLNEIKPGIGDLFNSADGLRAKVIQKGYPTDVFPSDMFTDIVTRYGSHSAEKKYHDNLLAQSETIISGTWTTLGEGTKKIIKDVTEGTVNLTSDVMTKINDETDGRGGKILGAAGVLRGAGKAKSLLGWGK